jgi:hypothetical protein
MQQTRFISLAYHVFSKDRAFRLLQRQVICPDCGGRCLCEHYSESTLIYRCPGCQGEYADVVGFEPIFAADPIQFAALAHYEIDCPYCRESAPLVGGSPRDGLYFVCSKRCHLEYTRTIRRF